MSLYRTWRPKSFDDLVGQDAVVRTLSTAIDTGRLAHAYLFSGPRGSGKTSAAKILARCIECELGPTSHPDNTCANCLAIFAGNAFDVIEIDAASNRGIDEIRALREAVKFPPSVMRSKVYIIDEAHMLTKEGANAFLKTLEEPPPHVVFVLATTAPEALPPTILSRCQRYAFRRIAIATMIARMRTIADNEGITIDDGALGAIAYRADGGLRDALTMLEQVAAFARGAIDAATVDAAFGQTGREFAQQLRDAVLDGRAADTLRLIDEASDAGADMAGLIRAITAEFRHVLVARVNPELLARDLSADDAAAAVERAAVTPQARLVRGLRLLADALAAGRASGNPRLELESALLRFTLQTEDPTLDALATRVTALEAGETRPGTIAAAPPAPPATGLPAAAPSPLARQAAAPVVAPIGEQRPPPPPRLAAPSTPASSPPTAVVAPDVPVAAAPVSALPDVSIQKLKTLWTNISNRARGEKPSIAAGLSRASVEAIAGEAIVLRVPDGFSGDILKRDLETLERAIVGVLGRPMTVRVVVGSPPSAPDDDSSEVDAGPDRDDVRDYAFKKLL